MPPDTVKVDQTTLFGNPFSTKDYGHDRAVELYGACITGQMKDQGIPRSQRKMLLELRRRPWLRSRTQNGRVCFGTATVSTRGKPGWWP